MDETRDSAESDASWDPDAPRKSGSLGVVVGGVLTVLGVPMPWLTPTGQDQATHLPVLPALLLALLGTVVVVTGSFRAVGAGGRTMAIVASIAALCTLGLVSASYAIQVVGVRGTEVGVGLMAAASGSALAVVFGLWSVLRH